MDDSYYYGGGAAAAAFGLFFALYFGILFVVLVGNYVLTAVSLMQFFKKVGVQPGIAWVPIYQYWKWLEVGGQKGWLSLLLFVPVANYVTLVFLYIGMYRSGLAFRKDGAFVILGIFLPFVWCFMLGSRSAVYEPGLLAWHGYPPPLAGYGAVPEGQRGPDEYYRQQGFAARQQSQQQAYAQQQHAYAQHQAAQQAGAQQAQYAPQQAPQPQQSTQPQQPTQPQVPPVPPTL